jgi:hypothetical protein
MSEPNLFIAGTTKGGTSSLRMWLGQHPQISLSEPKELHFFCGCPNPELRAAADLDEYLAFFPESEVRGEASPFIRQSLGRIHRRAFPWSADRPQSP